MIQPEDRHAGSKGLGEVILNIDYLQSVGGTCGEGNGERLGFDG